LPIWPGSVVPSVVAVVRLPSRYPKSALLLVLPRNALTVRERSGGNRMETRTFIHGICSEICNRQIPGSQAPSEFSCEAPVRPSDQAADRRPPCRVNSAAQALAVNGRPHCRVNSAPKFARYLTVG